MDAGCLVTPNDASTAVPRTTVDGLEAIEFEFEALAG